MIHLLFTFIQNIFIRFLFLIIKFRSYINHIQFVFIRFMNLFTKFQIVSSKGLCLINFLFLHIVKFSAFIKDLVKLAAG